MKTIKNIALIAAISLSYAALTFTLDQETLQKHLHDFQFSCDTVQEQDVKKVIDHLRNNPDQVNIDLIEEIASKAKNKATNYLLAAETDFFAIQVHTAFGSELKAKESAEKAERHSKMALNCSTVYKEFKEFSKELEIQENN